MKAYRESADGVKAVGMAIVTAADDYRTTGSLQAAQCAMSRIASMAQDKSLSGKMSSGQAYYVQGWVVGAIAIAYLKIRDAGVATPEQTASIARCCKAWANKQWAITTHTEAARTIISTGPG
jgi:poly(beta-D-mannuronate) lyase